MSAPTTDAVLEALKGVIDPDLGQDIVSLGFITRCNVSEDGAADVVINLTTPACPVKDQLRDQAHALVAAVPGITSVQIEMTAVVKGQDGPAREAAKDVKHIVAISSGKGGVGKSTMTVNLACALAQTGAKVGLLDCDVHGPDVPMMMGLSGAPDQIQVDGKTVLVPKERRGVKTMSIGYLVPDEQPVIWRGPMVHSFIRQMLTDVQWGELDYLLVDMPPGTGDAQLSLAQEVPLSGAVLVTTPQAVSAFDVTKAISMFHQVDVPILGIVENMSGLALEGTVEGGEAGSMVSLSLGSETTNCRSRLAAASAPCSTCSAPVERRRSRRSTGSRSSARSRSTPASARAATTANRSSARRRRHGVRCCDPRDRRAPRPASRREGVLEPADPRLRKAIVRSTVRRGGVDLLEHDEVPRRVGDHGLARAALELALGPTSGRRRPAPRALRRATPPRGTGRPPAGDHLRPRHLRS